MAKIVIFGATSAIACACAYRWLARGDNLFLVGRDPQKLGGVLDDMKVRGKAGQIIDGCAADLTRTKQHERLLADAAAAMDGIDIVLIAHGVLPDQRTCEQSAEQVLSAMETNALSAISLLTLAANYFEARDKGGVIAAISSVAGDRGRQSNYIYGAAKGMLNLFLQGLRNRLAGRGIAVVTIKPGFVDTPMTAGFKKGGFLWATPDKVARGIVKAIDRRADVVYLPKFWWLIMLIIRLIPERIFKKLQL